MAPAAKAPDGPAPLLHYPQRDRGRLSGIGGCGVRLSAFGGGLPRGWHVVPPREQTSQRASE